MNSVQPETLWSNFNFCCLFLRWEYFSSSDSKAKQSTSGHLQASQVLNFKRDKKTEVYYCTAVSSIVFKIVCTANAFFAVSAQLGEGGNRAEGGETGGEDSLGTRGEQALSMSRTRVQELSLKSRVL